MFPQKQKQKKSSKKAQTPSKKAQTPPEKSSNAPINSTLHIFCYNMTTDNKRQKNNDNWLAFHRNAFQSQISKVVYTVYCILYTVLPKNTHHKQICRTYHPFVKLMSYHIIYTLPNILNLFSQDFKKQSRTPFIVSHVFKFSHCFSLNNVGLH